MKTVDITMEYSEISREVIESSQTKNELCKKYSGHAHNYTVSYNSMIFVYFACSCSVHEQNGYRQVERNKRFNEH